MTAMKRILVATDFSEHAAKAVGTAIFLAQELGASIDLVHAYAVPWPVITPYDVTLPAIYVDETRQVARTQMDASAEKIRAAGIAVETHLSNEAPAEAIVTCAKEFGADLIVMGTHGYTGVKHALLGSVAERTLRSAPCSVLTVRGDDVAD